MAESGPYRRPQSLPLFHQMLLPPQMFVLAHFASLAVLLVQPSFEPVLLSSGSERLWLG